MLLGETNEKLTANLPDLEPSHSKKNKNKKKKNKTTTFLIYNFNV